ncbi:glycosyltransferase [Leeuwenhoekiella sp. W20_SRS_FM14]|uniref:glycosyltransferase n=1 Tax=Leeuwenhoekiella sp. W20_SRS_FM14 TaxID=3240270 RepID=UPI003F9D527F
MNKLKVVHIVEALGGGVYTYFINLTHVLAAHSNIDLTIIYSDKRQEIDPNKVAEDFHPNTTLVKIPMLREISPRYDFIAFKQLRYALKKLKPDVLHLHSSKAGILGRLAFLATYRFNTKLYYTPHGYSFLRKDISSFKRFVFLTIEFLSQKLTGGTIIACGDTELHYSKKIGPSLLVRNGINFDSAPQQLPQRSITVNKIGILGRITYARNPSLFNDIALQNPNLNFIWIGDGELRALLTAPNIEITGWFKDRSEGLCVLETIDVYLQTSLWEGLPIALLEAAARKLPIIATAIIGNKDIIANGKNGFLFKDASEFSNTIAKLTTAQDRDRIGKANFERCKLLFDSSRNFAKLISIYFEDHPKHVL